MKIIYIGLVILFAAAIIQTAFNFHSFVRFWTTNGPEEEFKFFQTTETRQLSDLKKEEKLILKSGLSEKSRVDGSKEKNKIELIDFKNPSFLSALKGNLENLNSYLDQKRARTEFQSSTYNSNKIIEQAIKVFGEAYPSQICKDDLRPKMIALFALKYSNKIKIDRCLEVLNKKIEELKVVSTDQHILNLNFDILAISEICSRSNYKEFTEYALRSRLEPPILRQINFGIQKFKESI